MYIYKVITALAAASAASAMALATAVGPACVSSDLPLVAPVSLHLQDDFICRPTMIERYIIGFQR